MNFKEYLRGNRRSFLEHLLSYLHGFVRLRIEGKGIRRFLQICEHKQLLLWKKNLSEERLTCYVSIRDFYSLHPIVRKTHVRVKILSRHGLPFFFYRYKKRKMFAIGILFCLLFLYTLSHFLWDIQVFGCDAYSDEQIVHYLEKSGLHLGKSLSQIDCAHLEEAIRQQFPDISWVSCEQTGTLLTVRLKDTIPPEQTNTNQTPCDLIATHSGTIESIITRSGTPLVKQGDKVKKGDILISGVIHIYDDFDNELESELTVSDGDIYLSTNETYHDEFPLSYYKKTPTGKKKNIYEFKIFGFRFSFPWSMPDYTYYETVSEGHTLRLGKTFYLPVSFTHHICQETTSVRMTYSKKEALAKSNRRFQRYIRNLKKNGIKAGKETLYYSIKNDIYQTDGTIPLKLKTGKIAAVRKIEKVKPDETS
ncbi:MAG: sporulation protein YqfD [Lachnospiraceae bacterium]